MKSNQTNNNGNIRRSIEIVEHEGNRLIRKRYQGRTNANKKMNVYMDIGRYGYDNVLNWNNLTKEEQASFKKKYAAIQNYFNNNEQSEQKNVNRKSVQNNVNRNTNIFTKGTDEYQR